jgi:pimeloyl-ACP methyl ester carboxylesterase
MFAAELAALSPHLVRRLVLVNAYGLWDDANPLPDAFSLAPPDFAAAKWANPDAAPKDTTPPLLRQKNLGAATKFLWPIPDRGLIRRLPFVEAPTLVVHGMNDGLIPAAYAQRLATLLPRGAFHPIADAGHMPMLEAEDEFTAAVATFLGAESGRPGG